jgi:hypothetical protein
MLTILRWAARKPGGVSLQPSYPFTASPEGEERDMAYSKGALNEVARRAGNRARVDDGRAVVVPPALCDAAKPGAMEFAELPSPSEFQQAGIKAKLGRNARRDRETVFV